MLGSVYAKTLYDKRWFTLGWSVGLLAMGLIMAAFFPAFTQDASFGDVLESMPEELQAVIGDAASLSTIEGYMASQVFDLRVPLLTTIMAIALFYGISTGEEKSGNLQMLSTLPISRSSILLQKYAAGVTIVFVVFVAIIASLLLGLVLIGETMSLADLFAMTFNSFLLTVLAGSFIYALSIGLGMGGAALGITSALLFALYLLFAFSLTVDWLEPFKILSPFYYNNPREVVNEGLSLQNSGILLASSVVLYLIAHVGFKERDLA